MEFLIKYWAQATVLIFAIGYVIKVILEFYIKKKEIKFNFLHKERAEVIKQLHLYIIEMSKEIELMALAHTLETINQGPTNQERKDLFHKIVKLNGKIHETVNTNRIFFSASFVLHFDKLFKNVNDNFILTSLDKNALINEDQKEYVFNNSSLFLNYYNYEFPKLKNILQKEFKKYL